MRRILRLAAAIVLLAGIVAVSQATSAGPAGAATAATTYTKTVRYGPYTIPAASGMEMGELENRLNLWVAKPCTNCFITSMRPNLVYPDGTRANVNTGPMLHHMVLASQFRSDATCSSNLLGLVGERFFASGNERTVIQFPSGYGYRVGYLDQWNLIYDLMNMDMEAKSVYIEMTFTYQSGSSGLEPVRPVWLDVDQCGDSEYSIPSGTSDSHWDWNVNVPGRIVAIGGHVHTEGHGVRIEATNQSTGQSICNSVASYGGSSDYIDMMGEPWLSSMTRCIANPVATVARGNTVLAAPHARPD
jgi:hypothetical protein